METGPVTNASSNPIDPHERESHIHVIQALDTIKSLEATACPHVYDFEIADGSIKKTSAPFSKLAGIVFSSVFDLFTQDRKEEIQKRKSIIQKTVSDSMRILQLYTSKVPHNDAEKQLNDRVINTIEQYNKRQKAGGYTLSQKIKNFFCKISDLSLDEIFLHIPINAFYQRHKITPAEGNKTAVKITHLAPKTEFLDATDPFNQQEKELFIMKATTLLLQEGIISRQEIAKALSLLRLHRPCIYREDLEGQQQVTLHTTISFLPGEEISIYGSFVRNMEKMRTAPLQDTFQLHCESHQSGFPHPLQTTGFNFGPKILPLLALASPFSQNRKLQTIFNEKQRLAKALLPKGELNGRAKALFSMKRMIIERNRDHFYLLLKQLMQAVIQQDLDRLPDPIEHSAEPFFALANLHHSIVRRALTNPLSNHTDTHAHQLDFSPYTLALETKISHARTTLLKLFSSGLADANISSFEEKIMRSSIRQQLAFINECKLDPMDAQIEERLFQHLDTLFRLEIADFSGTPLRSADDPQVYQLLEVGFRNL